MTPREAKNHRYRDIKGGAEAPPLWMRGKLEENTCGMPRGGWGRGETNPREWWGVDGLNTRCEWDKEKEKEWAVEGMLEGPSQSYQTIDIIIIIRDMGMLWATSHSLLQREEEMKRFPSEPEVKSTQIPQGTGRYIMSRFEATQRKQHQRGMFITLGRPHKLRGK